jgi:hypothetical protein
MMTQVKFTIESDIVSAFKARCAREEVSMTSIIRQYMITCQPSRAVKTKALTRPLRRKAVIDIIGRLNDIMELEMDYRDNIPEAFSQRYDAADNACTQLEEAISRLEEAF